MEQEPRETREQYIDPETGDLVSEINGWYEVVTKDNDGVAHVHKLRRHSTKVRPGAEELGIEPAQPAKVTPSRKKSKKRDYESMFVFSDAQIDYRRMENGELIPIHDERALKLARFICRDIQPDIIMNLGDTVDLAALSRFDPDSDHFHRTLGPSFQRVHDMYAEYRADNPNAKIVEVDSNHNTRLGKFAVKYASNFYNLRQAGADENAYPVLSYPHLANFEHLDIDWVSGYGAAEYLWNDDFVFMHGTKALKRSTAARISQDYPEVNVMQGHAHTIESYHRRNRVGRVLGSYVVGALCRLDGLVPGYHSAVDDRGVPVKKEQDWQQGVAEIRHYGDGYYQVNHIPIQDGKAYYEGNSYHVREES